ncbi:diguanylate cyclase domain-containing protein [Shewanella salipaludis]|uniref:Diguanylate cyclase n=1 Tax=Shewanella salipaludis TaxID=2723052 RepID=A0A972G050_9GAMM|nr:diguanylate cyclase [Shewanella salipaludis]NMH66373.1 diguanylate cyclase [Shewanella salipaludis]
MDFRVMVLSLLIWLTPLAAGAMEQMDKLNLLMYQYPTQAMEQINQLEKQLDKPGTPEIERLRLSLLKCFNLLQLGENEAALNLAQLGDAKAKQLKLDRARPYFLTCQADAYTNYNMLKLALPLLDSAVLLAKRYQQPQALVDALRLRGQLDTDTENFTSAIEDLRLALDIYPDIHTQINDWSWPPQAYLYAAMSNLLYASGDLQQAVYYANLGLQSDEAKGKVLQTLLINAAMVTLVNGDTQTSDNLLKQAKALQPEIASPLELAFSYGIIASIDFKRGRLDSAEELIRLSLHTFEAQRKLIATMRAKRLLAQILFAKGKDGAAMELIEQAISQGIELGQYSDLEEFYAIVSQHYAAQANFKLAYAYSLKRYQAKEQADQTLNDARFIQFKARLNQQESLQLVSQPDAGNTLFAFKGFYLALIAATLVLLCVCVWYLIYRKHRHQAGNHGVQESGSMTQELDAMLSGAKRGNTPLSLLLFNTSHVRQVDLSPLQSQMEQRLREQDKLIRYSMDELVIILPHTSAVGAKRVMEQLVDCIQPWQAGFKVNLGLATLQHFDTLASLIKRANISHLGQVKATESPASTPQAQ